MRFSEKEFYSFSTVLKLVKYFLKNRLRNWPPISPWVFLFENVERNSFWHNIHTISFLNEPISFSNYYSSREDEKTSYRKISLQKGKKPTFIVIALLRSLWRFSLQIMLKYGKSQNQPINNKNSRNLFSVLIWYELNKSQPKV